MLEREVRERGSECWIDRGAGFISFTCGFRNIFFGLFLGSNENPSLIAAGFS